MQRAIGRLLRGTCRKFRENDCPTLASEEVRQKNKSKEDFSQPKHSIIEALGLTTGLIFTYELTHDGRRRRRCFENTSPGSHERILIYFRNCPFALAKQVAAQPTLTTSFPISTAKSVRSPRLKRPPQFVTKKSIDTQPFLKEPEKFFLNDVNYPKRSSFDESDDDEEGVHFDPTISKYDEVRANKPQDKGVTTLAEKMTSDLLSVFGAFKFLSLSKDSQSPLNPTDIPTMEALDILEKGAELSSSRALYNLGVAYDRMNDTELSLEYYKRASDLGHPLASYNVALSCLKEGNASEGLSLMKYSAEHGVQEAADIISRL